MDPPNSDVKSRVRMFETSTSTPTTSTDFASPMPPPRSSGQMIVSQPTRPPPLRQTVAASQVSSNSNRSHPWHANPAGRASPERQVSPTKKVLSLNGPVSKRYYDIKARRNMLRGVSSKTKEENTPALESRSDPEDQRPRKVVASVPSMSTASTISIRNHKPASPSGANSGGAHRVWSESQQQEEHQTLERRVGVEDGAGWFSPEVHSTSSSDQTDSRPGPASHSPNIRDPAPSTYQSKVARLRTIRSRSPYFIAHQDRELRRNLEAASVILNEERESSVGSGSASTRSSLSREEVRSVAERALKLAKVRQESRARLILSSPLHQMLSEKRPRKVTDDVTKAGQSNHSRDNLHPFHSLPSSTSDGPSSSSSKPARLTRSERFAMVKAKSRFDKEGPRADDDSLELSKTTEESKDQKQFGTRRSKDVYPMFGYSQRFLAMTRQAGTDRRAFDDSSTITSESPITTETQTLSSGETNDKFSRTDRLAHGPSILTRRLPSQGSFPPPSVPVKTRSPMHSQSTSSSEKTPVPSAGSAGGSDSTSRAMNRSLASRTQRAKALKEALRRQENLGKTTFMAEAKPDPFGVPAAGSPLEPTSPAPQGFNEAFDLAEMNVVAQHDDTNRKNDNEFFDRLCKSGVAPVKTSDSETDSGEERFSGASTSSSTEAVRQRVEPPAALSSSMDTTTLDGEGLLNMTSSMEGSRYSLQKQRGPFQRHTTPPPPPPPMMYFDRKSDSSYDTSSESESPNDVLQSPAKSAFTQGSNNDAMRWWAKNYGQFSPAGGDNDDTDHTGNVKPLKRTVLGSPRQDNERTTAKRSSPRDPAPSQVIHTLTEDDEDVFSGLEEDKQEEDDATSGEESDGIPEPNVPVNTNRTTQGDRQPLPQNRSKPSPLKPILVQKTQESPSNSSSSKIDHDSLLLEPKALSVKSDITSSVVNGKTKKGSGWFRKRVDTIEEDESLEDDHDVEKPMSPRTHSAANEDLLDDSVMVASMSISKATGNKDGQTGQQGDHAALLNLGYSLVESISAFCKVPKRPLLQATTCVEKSQQSCREIEEGSSMAQTYMGEGPSVSQTYHGDELTMSTYRDVAAHHDHMLRRRDPEVWAMLEARERAHHLSSGAHGDFEETLTPPDGGVSYDSNERRLAHQARQLEAQKELLEIANQAVALYGGSAKGSSQTANVPGDLNVVALVNKSSNQNVKVDVIRGGIPPEVITKDVDTSISTRVGIFSSVMKNEGIEVLKLGRRNKWQLRYLTVTSEVMNFNNHSDSGDREAHCPLGLLWLKQRADTSQHGLSNLKKQGRGGLPFSSLRKIESVEGENARDAVESLTKIPKKLRVLFPTLHGVSIVYSFITDDGSFEQRSVMFCFKTDKDAESFATAMDTIKTIVSRGLDASRGLDP